MFGLISCSKKERKKQVCVILEEGAYLQVSKVKKKKSLPTDPNFEDHAIGNTHKNHTNLFVSFLLQLINYLTCSTMFLSQPSIKCTRK
jgi:hypothetical protein